MASNWKFKVLKLALGWTVLSAFSISHASASPKYNFSQGTGAINQIPLDVDSTRSPNPLYGPSSLDGHDYGSKILSELLAALENMQSRFFEIWMGGWPDTIDWTGCVMGTYISTTLNTLTRAADFTSKKNPNPELATGAALENTVSKYFTQTTSYYFAQDAFGLRLQAHDDMLWVVLGWLDSIKFANLHNKLHHSSKSSLNSTETSHSGQATDAWFGKQFEAGHAHRAHVFYSIVHKAWDRSLCGGGVSWNPRLQPYKNAITNEQYISASIGMYIYHPGDENQSPFIATGGHPLRTNDGFGLDPLKPHSPELLNAAIEAYDWIVAVKMLNKDGLFIDGFHSSDPAKKKKGVEQCDVRNEMVYTYNQGVILSGLRDLWEGTGNSTYLRDGHRLVQNVIKATGWTRLKLPGSLSGADTFWSQESEELGEKSSKPPQHGALGSRGILTEACDVKGTCSQDAQTFKGIFFTHLTWFCSRLPTKVPTVDGVTHLASKANAEFHRQMCAAYSPWVAWNAEHALRTRNEKGVFGMWWGAPKGSSSGTTEPDSSVPEGAVDIRNEGIPRTPQWLPASILKPMPRDDPRERSRDSDPEDRQSSDDYNERGRGRTVETQGGGVAVMRAWWEFWDLTKRKDLM